MHTRYNDVRRGDLPPPSPFALESIAILFELALGLSAWKAFRGNRWALRCNPSSGNLHPTEGYLASAAVDGLAAGVYHYQSRDHLLEQRAAVHGAQWARAFEGKGILIGITSIYWREAWKYGMRAWRYCQHDCGHAIAAMSYAAAALGWQTRIVHAASDGDVARLLGLDRDTDFENAEREAPDVLLWLGDPGVNAAEFLARISQGAAWHGRANRLSVSQVPWPDIDAIHRATHKPSGAVPPLSWEGEPFDLPPPPDPALDLSFPQIARQRRSAVDFDGVTSITSDAFFTMLDCLMPRPGVPPWNALSTPPLVHPALLVHRVDGLDPGIYVLVRDPAALPSLKQSMRPDWLWQKVGPDRLPLFLLIPYDLRGVAKLICCHQEIAADSCFALGMLSRFDVALEQPWRYRDLYWECGMLGHVLYLEAEAAGIRATGIGCFFDDEMHKLLGIGDHAWQSLYHFTMGGPVDDPRLSTLPPYEFQP